MPLHIRHEQMIALGHHQRDFFWRRMFDGLCRHFPDQARELGEEAMADFVTTWMADAEAHEFEYEDDIEEYLYLCFQHPPLTAEPRPDWVLEILGYPDRPAPRKLKLLRRELATAKEESAR